LYHHITSLAFQKVEDIHTPAQRRLSVKIRTRKLLHSTAEKKEAWAKAGQEISNRLERLSSSFDVCARGSSDLADDEHSSMESTTSEMSIDDVDFQTLHFLLEEKREAINTAAATDSHCTGKFYLSNRDLTGEAHISLPPKNRPPRRSRKVVKTVGFALPADLPLYEDGAEIITPKAQDLSGNFTVTTQAKGVLSPNKRPPSRATVRVRSMPENEATSAPPAPRGKRTTFL
jgi:hypothetical protein